MKQEKIGVDLVLSGSYQKLMMVEKLSIQREKNDLKRKNNKNLFNL